MLVPSTSRGAAVAAGHNIAMVAAAATPVLRTGLPKFVIRQRRHSSSKQPDTPKRAAAPVTSGQQQTSKKRDTPASGGSSDLGQGGQRKDTQGKAAKGGAGKHPEGKDKTSLAAQDSSKPADALTAEGQAQFDSVAMPPSVPSTGHYDPKVVHLASIFAQHRPISLHQPVPPSGGAKAFESLFQPTTQRRRTQDVIFTLASVVKSLDSAASTGNNKIVTPSPFDSAQAYPEQGISLEELAKTFRPFKAPPAPVPMHPKYLVPEEQQQQQQQAQPSKQRQGKRKARQTAAPASGEPVPPMPEDMAAELTAAPEAEAEAEVRTGRSATTVAAAATPFRERMRVRHKMWLDARLQRMREQWQLISVKRQRKLKMKKHKYKKFMRRTRNLRRRQDRL